MIDAMYVELNKNKSLPSSECHSHHGLAGGRFPLRLGAASFFPHGPSACGQGKRSTPKLSIRNRKTNTRRRGDRKAALLVAPLSKNRDRFFCWRQSLTTSLVFCRVEVLRQGFALQPET